MSAEARLRIAKDYRLMGDNPHRLHTWLKEVLARALKSTDMANAVLTLRGMRFIRASDYIVPASPYKPPYNWFDLLRDLYHDYLRSREWREKRKLVLARSDGLCPCGRPAQDVHHRTYARLFNESLDDLVGLCRPCHQQVHGIEF